MRVVLLSDSGRGTCGTRRTASRRPGAQHQQFHGAERKRIPGGPVAKQAAGGEYARKFSYVFAAPKGPASVPS